MEVFSPMQELGDVRAVKGSDVECGKAIGVRDPAEKVDDAEEVRRLRRRVVGEYCLLAVVDLEETFEGPPRR